jgi:hypothetical protein
VRRFAAWQKTKRASHSVQMATRGIFVSVTFVLLASCGSGRQEPSAAAVSFPEQSLMTVASSTGNLRIDVRTAPTQPPAGGVQTVQLVIIDSMTGAPQTGLRLDVLPWMPAMGHGASLTPSVAEQPAGTYVVSDVDFFMPGTWELRTSISGPRSDSAAPSFQIP